MKLDTAIQILMGITVVAVGGLFCGCEDNRPKSNTLITETPARFNVERAGVFNDELAYRETRGIYIITDRTTGKKYVGVSGIGISELGEHSEGKVVHPDER